MRVIAGYDDVLEQVDRRVAVQVLVGAAALDVSAYVYSVSVEDTLEAQAPTATVELSNPGGIWGDAGLPGVASVFAAGEALVIRFHEEPCAWVTVFDGEIVSGSSPTDIPAVRTRVQAVGGRRMWWERPVTSAEWTAEETTAIIETLFQAHGGLGPGDFDLPAGSRILQHGQCLEKTLGEYTYLLLAPWGYVPWWDPATGLLSTLSCMMPAAGTAVALPSRLNADLSTEWAAPQATRVRVEGGVMDSLVRLEIGDWPDVANFGDPWPEAEGVEWASGSKTDWTGPVYWADVNDTPLSRHTDPYAPGDYLWVIFQGEFGIGGAGYRGPEGVEFEMNDPFVSTAPVSNVHVVQDGLGLVSGGSVYLERFDVGEDRQIAQVKIRIDPALLVPGPAGYASADYWNLIVGSGAGSELAFSIFGRQIDRETAEQVMAQAWNETLVAAHGEQTAEVQNETLLLVADAYGAVEAEADRQQAMMEAAQWPANLALGGQDLRLLPGDYVSVLNTHGTHRVSVWASQVTQSWRAGAARTAIVGYALEAVAV